MQAKMEMAYSAVLPVAVKAPALNVRPGTVVDSGMTNPELSEAPGWQ